MTSESQWSLRVYFFSISSFLFYFSRSRPDQTRSRTGLQLVRDQSKSEASPLTILKPFYFSNLFFNCILPFESYKKLWAWVLNIGLSDFFQLAGYFQFRIFFKSTGKLQNSVSLCVEYWLVRSLPSCRKLFGIFYSAGNLFGGLTIPWACVSSIGLSDLFHLAGNLQISLEPIARRTYSSSRLTLFLP